MMPYFQDGSHAVNIEQKSAAIWTVHMQCLPSAAAYATTYI